MTDPLVESFEIPATYDAFKSWLTSYGISYEGGLSARLGERQLYDEAKNPIIIRWHYHINRNDTQGGIFFDIKFPLQEPLIVEATLFSNLRSNTDGPPLLVLENDPKLIAAFRELVEAIRAKYPQTDTSEILLAVDLPMPKYDLDGWDLVFNWYYRIPRWICPDLVVLAEKQQAAPGTVRNNHSSYVKQYGLRPIE